MHSNKIGLGIIGEKFVYAVLASIFKAKEDFRVKHVDWNNYSYGHGQDLRVFKRNRQVLGIECKNWRKLNRPYGTDIAEKEVIDRFANFAGGFKILVISFLYLLTRKARRFLKAHNIYAIEIGKLIGKNDFPRKGKNNKAFYTFKSKFLRLWRSLKWLARTRVYGSVQVSLDRFDSHVHNAHTTNFNPKHDTDNQKVTSNCALDLVFRALRIAQLKRKHPMYAFIPSEWLDKIR